MKNFKLTIKKQNISNFSDKLIEQIMTSLKQDFGLIDDPLFCNYIIKQFFAESELNYQQLKDLSVMVFGSDLPSVVEQLGEMVIVGSKYKSITGDFCPNCGHPDWITRGDYIICENCGHEENIPNFYYNDNPGDMNGFIALNNY